MILGPLRRCRQLEGTAAILPGRPALAEIRDAVFVPAESGGGWGLYAEGRQLGPNAASPDLPERFAIEAESGARHLYLGLATDHYGHFITDVLSRAWPLLEPGAEDLRLLFHAPAGARPWRDTPFIRDMLAGLGVAPERVAVLERPTRLGRVLVPAPALQQSRSIHGEFLALCRRIGRGLVEPAEIDRDERPVFLTKVRLAECFHKPTGEAALVAALDRRGIEIVAPETLSFSEQVRLLARKRIVLGIAGSALHTSLFSAPRRRIVGLHWASRLNANFVMMDRLNANRAAYYYPAAATLTRGGAHRLSWTIGDAEAVADALLAAASRLDTAFGRLAGRLFGPR